MKSLAVLFVGALLFVGCKKSETEKSWNEMEGIYSSSEFIVLDHVVCGEVRVNRLVIEEGNIGLSYTLDSEHSCDFEITEESVEARGLRFKRTNLFVLEVGVGLIEQPSPPEEEINSVSTFVLNKLNSNNLEFVITTNGISESHYFAKQ